MLTPPSFAYEHVSLLLNLIVQTYHYDATSVCILWNNDFPFNLHQSNVGSYAAVASLSKTAFVEEAEMPANRLDLLTKFDAKLVESINHTHCESFIAFENEIKMFTESFIKSVVHSKWRSLKNKFLFVYTKDQVDVAEWNNVFFKDLNNILFVEMVNGTLFNLKTTKFIGSRNDQPEELILLDRYHGETGTFEFNYTLYPDKLRDMKGREVIAAAFAYEPFSVLKKNDSVNNVMDVSHGNKDPSKRLLFDGTDAQALFHLCWLYNCTVQVDASEEAEWGYVYENLTSDGAVGLVFERKADVTMMAMYMWYEHYLYLDMSAPMSRSAVQCLVPAPRRLASWLLPLQPFHWHLWLGTAACLFLEAIGLLIARWTDRTTRVSWTESVYFGYVTSFKLFVSQGCSYLPSSFAVRIVLFSCYMIDIIITSVYAGGLASILTIPNFEEVADSFERLASHNQIWIGTATNWIISINKSEDSLTKQIIGNFRVHSSAEIKQKQDKTLGYAIESIGYGHYALLDYIDQDFIDGLKIMVDDIYNMYNVAFVSRGWPLLDKFNNMLLMMQSSGVTKYLQWKAIADYMNINLQRQIEASVKTNFKELGPIQLDMANFVGLLAVLIIGFGLSILVFIGELVYYRFRQVYRTTSWFLPFEPFEVNLWLGLSGCFVLEILGLLITRKMEMDTTNTWVQSFQFGYISTFKLFLSQSTHYVVRASSVRIVLFSCYMIDIIITSIYGGGLAAILTIPTWEEAPDSIDRMIKQNLIWAATSLAWIITLQNTQNEKIRKIVNLNRIYSPEELRLKSLTERIGIALERVQFGHFAMPGYIEQAAVDRMKIMIEDITYEYCIAYATPAWALMEKFNNFCLMVQSGGLLKYWEWLVVSKHLDTKMQNQVEASAYINFDAGGPVALGAKNFAGIMVLWVVGCFISMLVFAGEVALQWWTRAASNVEIA